MKPFSRFILAWLPAMLLAGCAIPGSIATNTSADELVRKLGKPSETSANPAGGEHWDYVYGPAGFETWRFSVDAGRVVRGSEQLLTFARLHQVQVGVSTEKDVRALLGKPSGITALRNGPAWDWRVNLEPTLGHFVVSFDRNGIATSTMVLHDFHADGDRSDP